MTTKELSSYLQDEDAAEKWLRLNNILKTFDACPLCGSGHLGRIRRERYKCYECRGEWNIRKGSCLESMHLECSIFIGCIKMFCDEIAAVRCSYELEVSRQTILRIYEDFRMILVGSSESVEDVNEVTFLINHESGGIRFGLNKVSNESLHQAKLFLKRQKLAHGQYFYSITYNNINLKKILREINKIDYLDEFYRYCQERVLKFRGRNSAGLFGILQELAFRFNHRDEQVFDIFVNRLAAPVKAASTRGALI